MLQKAILHIDSSKGTKKNGSAENRFKSNRNVAADAAQRLNQGAADRQQNNSPPQNSAVVDAENGMITVQYNPSKIRYHAAAANHKNVVKQDVGKYTETIKTITRKSTVDMSFELVFHKTDEDESVRKQMELVMNMIYDSPTKKVKFAWGKLEMDGKLTSFSGEYDMFDETGNPISGHMSMTIRTETSVKQIERTLNKLDEERKNT